MSTDFKWDDQLAQEFAEQYRFSSSRISIEQFKESKHHKPDTEKFQSAQQLAERYEKALKQIEQMSDPGDYWKAIIDMKAIATEALTPKTGSDEKTG